MKAKKIYQALKEQNPEPKGELKYLNHYTLLLAVVLSAQSTDKGVNKATASLFPMVLTPEAMLELGIDKLKEHIKSLGLYNTKADNIIKLSRILRDKHNGEVPQDRESLEELPGVGRKTANVVLNIAFAKPTIAVDTHVFRLANRTGLAPGGTPLAVEEKLLAVTPKEYLQHAHHWLILHGRYICKARAPLCHECVIAKYCDFKLRNREGS